MWRVALIGLSTLWLAACATGRPVGARVQDPGSWEPVASAAATRTIPPPVPEPSLEAPTELPAPASGPSREAVVSAALGLLGKTQLVVNGKRYGNDCTGFVRAVFEPLGINLMADGARGDNGVTAMWRTTNRLGRLYEGGRPLPGDLVFFKETYDLNRDGRVNDGLTHIGIVEDVEADGTVLVIHRVARGVVRYRMNLAHPTERWTSDGRKVNDWLRTEAPGSKPRLTGELFAGFGTLLPAPANNAAVQPSATDCTDCGTSPTGG